MTDSRLNFVLLVGEDIGRYIRCYGDRHAITPNLDRLAAGGARYENAFTHAPVCSPSRGGIISGKYPTAVGFHHHRSRLSQVPWLFTDALKDAGYHVSWPGKQDFNFKPSPDRFTDDRDWSSNLPPEPFFVYANLFQTHESRMREPDDSFFEQTARLKPHERCDPAKVDVPPYLPDTPGVRQEIARHYDNVAATDYQVGDVLDLLDRSGVADRTVVIFLADHGRGLPREKRWVYDRGIHVPLVIRAPGQIRPGTVINDLIAGVDIAPTILSLAGLPIPHDLHGQAFLGNAKGLPRKYVFAARDRLDEATDRVRAVRSKQYKYIRNYYPNVSQMQEIPYMELLTTTQAMRSHYTAGRADAIQSALFTVPRPTEELYDSLADPLEIHDLARDPALAGVLAEHRTALADWTAGFGDLGEIPESELLRRGTLVPSPIK